MRSSKPAKGKVFNSSHNEFVTADRHLSERADSIMGSAQSDQLGAYGEESDDDDDVDYSADNNDFALGGQSSDPQVLKLQDRIKFFRHRCVASLGNNLYTKAYEFLKESNSDGASPEEKRDGLLQILGEDSVGFWAILDQILFYEGMVDELCTLNTTTAQDTGIGQDDEQFYASDEEIRRRKNAHEVVGAGLGATGNHKSGLGMPLNEDSDLDLDDNENDGALVGGSASDKGEVL